jgi:tRNA-Thr(GGU) m(6)t(6)A37 methyltransferase TsaA
MEPKSPETIDWFATRPGEVAVELPKSFDAGLYYIGRIRTPWTRREDCPKNAGESATVCKVEIDERYARGLDKVETCTHLILLYWMDQARRDLVLQTPRHYGEGRGTFALRSPVRPNPIALSVVTLLKVERTTLTIRNIDCLDNTPLLDIKPYFASVDAKPDAEVGWHRDKK